MNFHNQYDYLRHNDKRRKRNRIIRWLKVLCLMFFLMLLVLIMSIDEIRAEEPTPDNHLEQFFDIHEELNQCKDKSQYLKETLENCVAQMMMRKNSIVIRDAQIEAKDELIKVQAEIIETQKRRIIYLMEKIDGNPELRKP